MTVPIVWNNRGDGDFLSIAFDGTVVAELLGLDFEVGKMYFVEMDPALLRGKTGFLSFYLQSVGNPNARVNSACLAPAGGQQ